MSIMTDYDKENKALTLTISGDFDASKASTFRENYEGFPEQITQYIINMEQVRYMDSTALGMLLALRECAAKRGADVHIINMNDVVLEIFRVLNFHKLFTPEYNRDSYKVDWVAKAEQ
ncbi:MAG: anti-anti-sigma factor [Legionellales bacterium]|nr:anti-anti-sigma factor [Legionellales bacterium]|tara:strand:- start:70831 stop:71184 length:354 start_codon:yes stop_codon:yes gene_type:complete